MRDLLFAMATGPFFALIIFTLVYGFIVYFNIIFRK